MTLKVSEETEIKLSIKTIVASTVVLMGGVLWLTDTNATAKSAVEEAASVKKELVDYKKEQADFQSKLLEKLSRVEGVVDILEKRTRK